MRVGHARTSLRKPSLTCPRLRTPRENEPRPLRDMNGRHGRFLPSQTLIDTFAWRRVAGRRFRWGAVLDRPGDLLARASAVANAPWQGGRHGGGPETCSAKIDAMRPTLGNSLNAKECAGAKNPQRLSEGEFFGRRNVLPSPKEAAFPRLRRPNSPGPASLAERVFTTYAIRDIAIIVGRAIIGQRFSPMLPTRTPPKTGFGVAGTGNLCVRGTDEPCRSLGRQTAMRCPLKKSDVGGRR